MQVRKCVINMCITQFLDMKLSDILEMRSDGLVLDIWKLDDESLYAADIRWDNEHPEVVAAFNSSSRNEEPVPEEYGDSSVSMEELLNKESD